MKKKYYITTPIYYVNDKPHIGHAYTSIAADVIARFKKLEGYEVIFLTGTDEHGQKIEKAAKKLGYDNPQEFTDKISENFKNLTPILNLSNTDFIRTTEQRHIKYVKEIWRRLLDNQQIYLGKYSGWYAVRDEAFYNESELVNGKAPTGADVEWVEEPSYFFKLSAWQDKLLEFYEENPSFILPETRSNEVISFVKSGLNDLSISRTSFKWGIGVPGQPDHIIYVWLDALFNYISALEDKKDIYWPCDLHIVGKDILRFHAVYWPAFLMAANIELPKRVFAHGWWTNEGEKISKSLGNVIDPIELVNTFGLDYFRFFLIREVTFGNDGNYSKTALITRANTELANKVGNLIHRTASFIYKHCDKQIPTPYQLDQEDLNILDQGYSLRKQIKAAIDNQSLHLALEMIINFASLANNYIDKNPPWILLKNDKKRTHTVLYVLTECIRLIAILLQPFTPASAGKILDYLNIENRRIETLDKNFAIIPGAQLTKPEIFFDKIEN